MVEAADLARIAYDAYGETTDHKNFRGEPMPEWVDLPARTRTAWTAAASAIVEALGEAK